MNGAHPIIEQPELQTVRQRLTGLAITLIAWSAWLSLWLPCGLEGAASMLGLPLLTSDSQVAEIESYRMGLLLFGTLCSVSGFLLTSWTLFDLWRTQHRRLRLVKPTEAHDLARDFGVVVPLVSRAHRNRNLVMHFHHDGSIDHIEFQHPWLDEEKLAG